jgi:2-polyprenyl-3-methyl-5-hydroxy-6-metoxy-1,4-benzoquinol methylase
MPLPNLALPDLSTRRREAEWMDRPDADVGALRASLRFIRRVNTLLGYTRATLSHLRRFSRSWTTGQTIRILDVATGSADIPLAILKWARRRRFDVHIVGADLHPITVAEANLHRCDRFSVVRADALDLPFADGSFDYALTAMFLHHLDDAEIVRALREMDRVARRGVIAADLIRNRRAYAWISLFTATADPMVRHDALVSVRQAFSRAEVLALGERAGLAYAGFFQHFAHRFVLAGEKPHPRSPISAVQSHRHVPT